MSAQIQINIKLTCTARKLAREPVVLAKRWGITPERAQMTIHITVQRRIRTMFKPSVFQKFRTNNRNLCYCCLEHPVFLGMMFASTESKKRNRCAQVYDTDFGWTRAFPMASTSEAHETLLLLFIWDGVPPACICNNAKKMIQNKFYQKLKDGALYLKQLEPYTPWSNDEKRKIKEFKKRAGHKLLWSSTPKC